MKPGIDDIVVLGESAGLVRHVRKGPDRLLAGDPQITNTRCFTSPDERFTCGIWESTPGKFRAVYDEDEFYVMLSGSVTIADQEGRARTFKPGESIVVPAGFVGTWEVLEPTVKLYAHYRPDAALSQSEAPKSAPRNPDEPQSDPPQRGAAQAGAAGRNAR